jgi:hypothetical protein
MRALRRLHHRVCRRRAGFRADSGGRAGPEPGTEPERRVIQMTRRAGAHTLVYRLYPTEGWHGSYDAVSVITEDNATSDCTSSYGVDVEDGLAPTAFGGRTRALLLQALEQHERFCRLPAGNSGPVLEGFDAAFAVLASWFEGRLAELDAYYEAEVQQGMAANNFNAH